MKNIVAITLTVLTLLLLGFLVYTFSPQGKDLTFYLPEKLDAGRVLTLFQKDAPPETHTIYIGPTEEEQSPFEITSATGHYIDSNNRLALTVWVEKLEDEGVMDHYKEMAWKRYSAPERGGVSEKTTFSDREVFLSFRTIEATDDTSKMITMGGGYVFFPEDNTVVAYTLYNPRLYSCEDLKNAETCLFDKDAPLPTLEDNKKIAEQIAAKK